MLFMEVYMGIVERIRISASEKGLTVAKVEKLLKFGNSTIRKWDKNSPSLDKVIAAANLLEKPLGWLATGEYDRSEDTYSDFLIQYEKLSDTDKRKIEYFMEISLSDSKYISGPSLQEPILMMETSSGYPGGQKELAVLGYAEDESPLEGLSTPIGYTLAPANADYVLIARGDSMAPVIHDGEYIYVKNCGCLSPGDIGVFYVGGRLRCMTYRPSPSQLVLQPLAPGLPPLSFPSPVTEGCKIQGKVLLTRKQAERLPE